MGLTAAIIAALGFFSNSATSASVEENLLLFARNAPMPVIVARGTELAEAEKAAAKERGCFAVSGAGASMEPIYLSGTAVVIRVGGYDQLREGTPVVYRSRTGVTVAHMLVEKKQHGWTAVGLANDNDDGELVTADNFIGVVTHAFASKMGALPKALANRIAATEQSRGRVASGEL